MRKVSVLFFSLLMTVAIARTAAEAPAAEPEDPEVAARCCSECPQDDFEDPCWNTCWFGC